MGLGSGSMKLSENNSCAEKLAAKELEKQEHEAVMAQRDKQLVAESEKHDYVKCDEKDCVSCEIGKSPYQWGRIQQYNLMVSDLKKRGIIV